MLLTFYVAARRCKWIFTRWRHRKSDKMSIFTQPNLAKSRKTCSSSVITSSIRRSINWPTNCLFLAAACFSRYFTPPAIQHKYFCARQSSVATVEVPTWKQGTGKKNHVRWIMWVNFAQPSFLYFHIRQRTFYLHVFKSTRTGLYFIPSNQVTASFCVTPACVLHQFWLHCKLYIAGNMEQHSASNLAGLVEARGY